MLRYKINKISEVPKDELLTFYKKVYKKRYKTLANNWRWWYRSDYSEYKPIVLSVDNKIIGQAGLLPVDLDISGKKIPAIWFVDFIILDEFQGKGFGRILATEWMKICPNQITFCNDQSLKVFKKLGWKNNLLAKRLVKPINSFKFFPIIKKINLKLVNKFLKYFMKKKYNQSILTNPHALDKNFKIIQESFNIRKNKKSDGIAEIIRDESWLRWRLMECPYKKDIYFFEYKNNFAIVHIFWSENIKKLNILYNYSTDKLENNDFFYQIINWSMNNDIDLVWAVNANAELENIFPKILNKSINFASWSSDQKTFEILQKGLSNPQGIDSDIDSSLYIE